MSLFVPWKTRTFGDPCGCEAQHTLSTHTLINPESVCPLEPDLPKSNQYVNSVISVKSVTTPFTQKPELSAFQSCSPYLWYEIQILYDEGEKHRRDAGWGLSSSYIFSMAIQRTCHPGAPSLPPSLSRSYTAHRYRHIQSVIKIFLQRQMS